MPGRLAPRDRRISSTLAAVALLALSQPGQTAERGGWSLCGTTMGTSVPAARPADGEGRTEISADAAVARPGERAFFHGDVVLTRPGERVRAARILYDTRDASADAWGDVEYETQNLWIAGERAHLDLARDRGMLFPARYRLPARHASGEAGHVQLLGPGRVRLSDVTYTTCDPDDLDWSLSARRVTLDQGSGRGTARGVVTRFKRVPFLYAPYLSFPIDDRRQSGFLVPRVGNSNDSGFDVATPYYWNIAPNQDATLTPRYLGRRGVMMGAEYRYLLRSGEGRLYGEYLPDDTLFGEDRGLAHLEHDGRLAPRWRTHLDLNDVSDTEYLDDFGDSLSVASQTHLSRRADLRYHGSRWSMLTRLQGYQTLDETITPGNEPYEQLPRIDLDWDHLGGWLGLDYRLESELTNFERDASVTGTRLDLYPQVRMPLGTAAYTVTPKVGLRHTAYALDNEGAGADSAPSRTVPITSLDARVFFERDLELGGRSMIQTLEPRLFYLHVPFREQSDLIVDPDGNPEVFDTGLLDLNMATLFRENRFSGADRIGDANRLTTAVTSRLIERDTGRERARLSVGQIHHFRDREVTLPGRAPATDARSPLIADVTLRLDERWSGSATAHWDPADDTTERGTVQLHYQPDEERIVNLAYRRRVGDIEQSDVSFLWPLGRRWSAVGRWNYSLRDDLTLEALAGLEYQSCCWALRVVGRSHVTRLDTERRNTIMLQLELKGLSRLGDEVGRVLERDILGYRR